MSDIENASKRWIEEGKIYKDAINAWLDVIYLEQKSPEDPEPKETRTDLAAFVRDQIIALNASGEHEKLRALFPPDNEPFGSLYEEEFTQVVFDVLYLPDSRILATVGGWNSKQVYLIDDDRTTKQEGVIAFGSSHDKKYFAKAVADRIDIVEGWDGEVQCSLLYPEHYGSDFNTRFPGLESPSEGQEFGIESIEVFNDGESLLLCSSSGIYVIDKTKVQLLHPDITTPYFAESMEDNPGIDMSYANADLSPDNVYISLGDKDSSHLIFKSDHPEEHVGTWRQFSDIDPRSAYPHRSKFNYLLNDEEDENKKNPHLALSSCHFSSSATIGISLSKLSEGFTASGYDADEALDFIDERSWIYSILPSAVGYYLGSNNGYIWYKYYRGDFQIGYLHIGGTIMSMDLSEDRKTLVVGTYSGQVVKLVYAGDDTMTRDKNNRKDPYLITNLAWVDEKRYLFWRGMEPMKW